MGRPMQVAARTALFARGGLGYDLVTRRECHVTLEFVACRPRGRSQCTVEATRGHPSTAAQPAQRWPLLDTPAGVSKA